MNTKLTTFYVNNFMNTFRYSSVQIFSSSEDLNAPFANKRANKRANIIIFLFQLIGSCPAQLAKSISSSAVKMKKIIIFNYFDNFFLL